MKRASFFAILIRHLINFLPSPIKVQLKKVQLQIASLRWRGFEAVDASTFAYSANVLIVKEKKYVDISYICVLSFLFFHPKSQVALHVDNHTKAAVNHKFRNLIRKGTVLIRDVSDADFTPWQSIKLNLICSLSGTKSLFMDADLRWNGPLPPIKGITFFVDEFSFGTNENYANLNGVFGTPQFLQSRMKNLSFFTFWGYEISDQMVTDLKALEIEIRSSDFPFHRMSEQIALSYFADTWGQDLFFLKTDDRRLDGAFVESAYFGVTGLGF